jgi:general secretion pathway protein B
MSYILDALRKSEKERQAGQVPGLPDLVTETRQPSSPRWLWLAGLGLLLLNLAGLGYWLLHRQEPTPPPAEVANAPVSQPVTPAQPSAATADQAAPQPRIVNAGVPAPNPAVPAPVAVPTPVLAPSPATVNVAPPAATPMPAQPPLQTAPASPVAAPVPVTTPPVAAAAPVPVAPPVAAPTAQMPAPPAPVQPSATPAPPATPTSAPVTPPAQTRKTPSSKAARTQPVTPPPVAAAPPAVTTRPTYTPPRQARAPARALPPARSTRPAADEFDEADQELEREGELMADAGPGRYTPEPQVSIRRPAIRGGTPDLRELPLDFQERVPPMKISMFAYSKNPAERFVIIDMRKYRAGDRLPGGILLLNIQAENLLLELDGQKFLVPRF